MKPVTYPILSPKRKRIALVAHDHKKDDLMAWIETNRDLLGEHDLCATGTTGTLIHQRFGLEIEIFFSGPMGGDQQIGAAIAEERIDILVFFWDPLEAQPHDPDVRALLRIAVLYDAIVAMNPSTADWVFNSPYIHAPYTRHAISPKKTLEARVKQMAEEV